MEKKEEKKNINFCIQTVTVMQNLLCRVMLPVLKQRGSSALFFLFIFYGFLLSGKNRRIGFPKYSNVWQWKSVQILPTSEKLEGGSTCSISFNVSKYCTMEKSLNTVSSSIRKASCSVVFEESQTHEQCVPSGQEVFGPLILSHSFCKPVFNYISLGKKKLRPLLMVAVVLLPLKRPVATPQYQVYFLLVCRVIEEVEIDIQRQEESRLTSISGVQAQLVEIHHELQHWNISLCKLRYVSALLNEIQPPAGL